MGIVIAKALCQVPWGKWWGGASAFRSLELFLRVEAEMQRGRGMAGRDTGIISIDIGMNDWILHRRKKNESKITKELGARVAEKIVKPLIHLLIHIFIHFANTHKVSLKQGLALWWSCLHWVCSLPLPRNLYRSITFLYKMKKERQNKKNLEYQRVSHTLQNSNTTRMASWNFAFCTCSFVRTWLSRRKIKFGKKSI